MKKEKATLDQAAKILSIFKGVEVDRIQEIIESGLLAVIRDGNIPGIMNALKTLGHDEGRALNFPA